MGSSRALGLALGALAVVVCVLAAPGTRAEWTGPAAGPAREDAELLRPDPAPEVEAGRILVSGAANPLELAARLPAWIGVRGLRPVFPARSDWRGAVFLVDIDPAADLADAIAAVRAEGFEAQPNFSYAPDATPDDSDYGKQYAHALAGAPAGWDLETGDPDSVIAVIGTGIDRSHPDLAANLWQNTGEIPANGLDDDANGFVDDRHGWDFQDGDADPAPEGSSHETSVAGVAGAVADDGLGIAGVLWQTRLMALRVAYTSADVAAAIDYATANGAWVINMSFGNYASSKYGPDSIVAAVVEEADAAGVVLVSTAGNDATSTPRYPAALGPVIAVAATDAADRRANFSNHGAWIDVAAPGSSIYAPLANGGHGWVNGTSFAAPYVSGLAALLLSKDGSLTPAQVSERIFYSVDKIDTDYAIGTGRISVQRALELEGDPEAFALIHSPRSGLDLSGPTLVEGVALGGSFDLSHRREGEAAWTEFASGPGASGVLGQFDPAGLAPGSYEIRLRSQQGGWIDEHVVGGLTLRDDSAMPGWPLAQGSQSLTSPTFSDLDGDGDLELLAMSADAVSAWHHDGTPVAGWPVASPGAALRGALSTGDLDGDGLPEVLKLSYTGELTVWRFDGQLLPRFSRSLGPLSRTSPVLGDVNGDGALELVTSVYGGGAPARLDVIGADGASLPGWPISLENNQQSAPALADLDGDGTSEIVVHGWTTLYAFHGDGSPVAGFPIPLQGSHTSPVALDVDADGAHEIIAFSRYAIHRIEGDGSSTALAVSVDRVFHYETPALGDLDGDGSAEVCIGDDQGRAHLISLQSGASLPGWPVSLGAGTSCSVADLDGDGAQELLLASEDARLRAFEADARPVSGFSTRHLGAPIQSSATLGDVDGDGALELAALNQDGDVWLFKLSDSASPLAMPAHWPTYQSSAAHTGELAVPLPEAGGLASLLCGAALLQALSCRRRSEGAL